MDANLLMERQPPLGSVGPPRGQVEYPYKYLGTPAPPPPDLRRSPRLMITPSSPDNVGPALGRLGRSIGISVEMLATVGETIGEENPDIRGDMQEACRESRNVASGLEKLCESLSHTVIGNSASGASQPFGGVVVGPNNHSKSSPNHLRRTKSTSMQLWGVTQGDLEALIRTLRRLLAAVTRILLLADNVVVKQLLVASNSNVQSTMVDGPGKGPNPGGPGSHTAGAQGSPAASNASKAAASANNQAAVLASMSTMHHFNEFVKAFCDFGSDMVHLIRISTGNFRYFCLIFGIGKKKNLFKVHTYMTMYQVEHYPVQLLII